MITKEITFDHQVLEDGHIQVRQITRIMEDGVELSKSYHRHVVEPGADITNEDEKTQKLAMCFHTKDTVTEHMKKMKEARDEFQRKFESDMEEALIVSEGETVEGEELKRKSLWDRFWGK